MYCSLRSVFGLAACCLLIQLSNAQSTEAHAKAQLNEHHNSRRLLAPTPAPAAALPLSPAKAPGASQSTLSVSTTTTASASAAIVTAFQNGDYYNVTTAAVAAASASINTVTMAEDAARNGDMTSATIAIYVAQETTAAAAAALQKDYSSAINHTNTANNYLYGYQTFGSMWTVDSIHLAATAISTSASVTITAASSSATAQIFEVASAHTMVWSSLMNATSYSASKVTGLSMLSYAFYELSIMASQMTFMETRQTDYFDIAYSCTVMSEELLGMITQLQMSRTVSFSQVTVSTSILAMSSLQAASTVSDCASVLVSTTTDTSVTSVQIRTIVTLVTQAITQQVNYVSYWSGSYGVLSESARALYASNETTYCVEAYRQNDYTSARRYAQGAYYYSSLTSYRIDTTITITTFLQLVQTRVSVVYNQFVTISATVVVYTRQIVQVTVAMQTTMITIPVLPPALPPLPMIMAPKLAPLSQPLGAPTPGTTAKTPAIAPSATRTAQTPMSGAPSMAPTVGLPGAAMPPAKTPAAGPMTTTPTASPPIAAPKPASASPPATSAPTASPPTAARPPSNSTAQPPATATG